MYTRKIRGPRTEPWGTPAGMDFHDDKVEPTLTRCRRRVRWLVSQVRAIPRTSMVLEFGQEASMPKTFEKSKKHADTARPESRLAETSCTRRESCSSVLSLDRNPDWSAGRWGSMWV